MDIPMKRFLFGAFATLLSFSAIATTSLPLSLLATQAANTVVANVTGSASSPTAFAMPTCSTSTSALQWTSGTGFTCYASSATTSGTLAQFAATTSAQVAGVVSDETGSGPLVFATGSAINPTSIGATTPGTAAFTTLKASQTAKVFAQNTSAQSIPSSAATVVTGWTTVSDQHGDFVASTGTFTAPATGYYLVSSTLTYNGAAAVGSLFETQIFANAVSVSTGIFASANATVTTSSVTSPVTLVSLTAGQTIQVKALQNGVGAIPLNSVGTINTLSITQVP
jgi:hypothetical protein